MPENAAPPPEAVVTRTIFGKWVAMALVPTNSPTSVIVGVTA